LRGSYNIPGQPGQWDTKMGYYLAGVNHLVISVLKVTYSPHHNRLGIAKPITVTQQSIPEALGSRFTIRNRNRQAISNQSALGNHYSARQSSVVVSEGLLRPTVTDQKRLPPRGPLFFGPASRTTSFNKWCRKIIQG